MVIINNVIILITMYIQDW